MDFIPARVCGHVLAHRKSFCCAAFRIHFRAPAPHEKAGRWGKKVKRIAFIALALCIAARALPARAEEKDAPAIDFWSASQVQHEASREQWKPRVQNALELLQNETSSKEEKAKKSDKVWLVAFGTIFAAGLVGSVVMNRENARGGEGSICCRSAPYIPGRKPPIVEDPNSGPSN